MEIFIKGRYGTICDDGFDQNAAAVVCRSLGYISGVTQPNKNFGLGRQFIIITIIIQIDLVFCVRSYENLSV